MAKLTLHMHPLASFCHKVLIGLYENGTPFEARTIDLGDPVASAPLREAWAVGKIPVLFDGDRPVAETTIMLEYLQQYHPGPVTLFPRDPEPLLAARLWDRFFDNYVQSPLQKIVGDRLRKPGQEDAVGVLEAKALLQTAYEMLERQLTASWAVGEQFTVADCAAAPSLFFARSLVPITQPRLASYFERLVERPSFARVLDEARPFFKFYPYAEALEARFR